jgi:Helix-turn-helix domain
MMMTEGHRVTPRKLGSLKPYTTGEIAQELGVSINAVIAMLERGEIPWHWSDQEHQRGRRLVKVKDWNAWKQRQAG